jgi:DNA polymerase (family 10)
VNAPDKEAAIALLESIGRLLELKGENPFKIRAYANAARALETFPGSFAAAAAEGRLDAIPGIGKAIAEKLAEFAASGRLAYHDELRGEFPESIHDLFELQGLGPKKIKALYDKLGVASVEALEKACRDGQVAKLAGFGAKTADNILRAIGDRAKHAGLFRLGDVAAAAEGILAILREHPETLQAAVAGSYRRRKEVVHDLDFIVATRAPEALVETFVTLPDVETVLARGATKASVRLASGVQADLRAVANAEYPFALAYFTGSKEHNIVMRSRAIDRGWTLNEYRLAPGADAPADAPAPTPVKTEADLYAALGLAFVEPELRENLGEIAAAERGTLPELIRVENLRGTFHCHTTASDGRSTLEEMARAAQDLGF